MHGELCWYAMIGYVHFEVIDKTSVFTFKSVIQKIEMDAFP